MNVEKDAVHMNILENTSLSHWLF